MQKPLTSSSNMRKLQGCQSTGVRSQRTQLLNEWLGQVNLGLQKGCNKQGRGSWGPSPQVRRTIRKPSIRHLQFDIQGFIVSSNTLQQATGVGAIGSFNVVLFFNKDDRFQDEYIALLYFLPQNFDAIDLRPQKIFWDGLPCQPKAQTHSHHTAFILF